MVSLLIPMLSSGTVCEWNYGKAFEKRAIRRLSVTAFMGVLVLTIAGCGSGSEESIAPTPSASQVVKPAAQPFDKPPMVAQQAEEIAISSPPGLIQPTNATQRAKQVQKGRQDPFAALFVQAVPSVPATPKSQTIVPRLPNLPVARSQKPAAVQPGPRKIAVSRPKAVPLPIPGGIPPGSERSSDNPGSQFSPGSEPFSPPPPQEPDLAKGVTVRGVIQIGNEMQAIVQVPNEVTSRYVRLGQRLSNGQVLVKRIEMKEGSDPVVILEQYGVEVARMVGEQTGNPAQAATPSDASPVPPPPDSAPSTDSVPPPPDSAPSTDSVPPPPDSAPSTDSVPSPPDGAPSTDSVPSPPDGAPSADPVPSPPDSLPSTDPVPSSPDDASSTDPVPSPPDEAPSADPAPPPSDSPPSSTD